MKCLRWTALAMVLICLSLGSLAVSAPPSVPRDTLPEKLELEKIPLGLESVRPLPADNPLTEGKVQLGRKLFFDPILSVDRSLACASCHDPAHGFASAQAQPVGVGGKVGKRKAPSILNRAYAGSLFWDGREPTLEAQALRPIDNPVEMGAEVEQIVKRLREEPEYRKRFEQVFQDGVSAANLARSLAAFERTLLSGNSRADQFKYGKVAALNERERHGLWLFESRAGCWRCHSGRNFSDEKYHNTGVSWGKGDLGRFEVTQQPTDRGRFKTPSLRGVAEHPPFMHDGSLATLQEVVEFYNRGGIRNSNLDAELQPLSLDKEEILALVEYLKALSGTPSP